MVLTLAGDVDLPAGRQEIILVPHEIVDGRVEGIGVGMAPEVKPAAAEEVTED